MMEKKSVEMKKKSDFIREKIAKMERRPVEVRRKKETKVEKKVVYLKKNTDSIKKIIALMK